MGGDGSSGCVRRYALAAKTEAGEIEVSQIALLLLGILFAALLVRGLISGRIPSRFGTAIRREQPVRFYVNCTLIGLFAAISFAGAAISATQY
jgi:hypothetical protein